MKKLFIVLTVIGLSIAGVEAKTLGQLKSAERYKLNDSTTTAHTSRWSDGELTIRNNDIQRQVVQYTRCIYTSSITTPTAETREYVLPPKCISIDRVSFLQTTSTSSYKKVEAITMGGLDVKLPTWESATSGKPMYYYERANYIGFDRPVSSVYASTGAIKIDYFKYPDDMDDDADEPFDGLDYLDLYHDTIVLGVVASCKFDEGKSTDAALYQGQYVTAINGMIDSLNQKSDQKIQHITIGK